MKIFLTVLTVLVFGSVAQAQDVGECDWRSSARNLGVPWDEYSKEFSNGKVRIALLDTIEPAAGALHLLIISPPYGELGSPQCKVVSFGNSIGFADMDFSGLVSDYSPATGLVFEIPVKQYFGDGSGPWEPLTVTLNQATGLITATLK
ncbi:MAG: hypothetical protein KAT26_05415 [Marinosulfonomonas sp.]|nr:hypothetical protein [Marinosulfonomonas sp.]